MLNADVISFREFVMHEPLPLAKIHEEVLEFLKGREDAVLFGAQAVNAYVDEPRATQDVDIMALQGPTFAEELRKHLSEKFHIAARVRAIRDKGLRVYQVRKEGNRHLVDVRIQDVLPDSQIVEEIKVLSPPELIASKVISYISRQGEPKSWTDRRDLAVLLAQFPELKADVGPVTDALLTADADEKTMDFWREIVAETIVIPAEDDDLNY